MADEEETTEEAKPKNKMMGLIMWVGVAVVAIGGGFATPFVLQKMESGESDEVTKVDPNGPTALVDFGEVTVTLNEPRMDRYLRVAISLLIEKEIEAEFALALEEKTAILKSWLLGNLSQKTMADVRGAVGQNRLRREIRTHFNSVLYPDSPPLIREVLFLEFNVQ